ncbi:MAG: long-chain fatty acid--CoA ligase [Actinomycetota bacterium]|nr:long-chain fatty acid--CoA ligase [Actinomycetota bacterium]
MREFSVPALVEHPAARNLAELVTKNADEAPDEQVFARNVGGAWKYVTAAEFAAQVTAVAKGLHAAGVGVGDRVGLLSRTRYEWTLADFAIWTAGAVTVPLYDTSSPDQVRWVLEDSGAVACLVETAEHAATVEQMRSQLPELRSVEVFEDGGVERLSDAGRQVTDEQIEARREAVDLDALATVIYTSGTTGRPKGCELTHGNFMLDVANVTQSLPELFLAPGRSTLMFLPLAHVLARILEIACVMTRTPMGFTSELAKVSDDLATFQPTFVLAVPRVFEKVYNTAAHKAAAAGKGRIFTAAADVAVAYSRAQDTGGPGLSLRARHAVFDRLVYGKLRAALGGRARFAISGGAPLGERLGHFYRGLGFTVLEGYGLTETTAATTANMPGRIRIGTVGQPIAGTAVRIADDGEVLIAGPNIFRGYWRNPDATTETLSADGWLHTGDLGELDDEGFLRITGRKKEILVTSGGKNIAPAVLEDQLRAHPLVGQCMVVGDAKPYVAALVTLDAEALPRWLEQQGRPADTPAADLAEDPQIHTEIETAVAEANATVSRPEAIKRFRVLPIDFTEEGGQLTPTMKLKRNVVMAEFADEVDALYS